MSLERVIRLIAGSVILVSLAPGCAHRRCKALDLKREAAAGA